MKKILAKKMPKEWTQDPKGYFIIEPKIKDGVIYAHYYNNSREYQFTIQGKDAESIYYTILRKELISTLMHAAYVGSELQKAEILIRFKKGIYVQDQPLIIKTKEE